MKGGANRKNNRSARLPLASDRDRPLDSVTVSANDDLSGGIIVGHHAHLV
jgi:hypothetical protein